jgi:hypothetical protein
MSSRRKAEFGCFFQSTSRTAKGKLAGSTILFPMPASCKHPQVRVVAREEDAEFVECQLCGEVFDSSEFKDILNEEDAPEEQEAQG